MKNKQICLFNQPQHFVLFVILNLPAVLHRWKERWYPVYQWHSVHVVSGRWKSSTVEGMEHYFSYIFTFYYDLAYYYYMTLGFDCVVIWKRGSFCCHVSTNFNNFCSRNLVWCTLIFILASLRGFIHVCLLVQTLTKHNLTIELK